MSYSSLKRRTLIAVSLMCICVIAGIYFFSMSKMNASFIKHEQSEAKKDATIVEDFITNSAQNIINKTSAWAQSDDTYLYLKNKNKNYESSNLQNNLISSQLNLVSFWSLDKKLIWAKNIDLQIDDDAEKFSSFSNDQITKIQTIGDFFHADNYLDKRYAFEKLNNIPYLLVSMPITSSNGKSPINGYLISGIKLDDRYFDDLSHQLHQKVYYRDLNLPRLSSEEEIQIKDSETLSVYATTNVRNSQSSIAYRLDIPRKVHDLYNNTLKVFLTAMIFGGIAFVMVTLGLVNRLLTSRILTLLRLILKIKNTGDLSQRVPNLGDDEIGQLGHSFNEMFEEIEKLRAASFHNEKMASLGEMAGGIAHEINNPITIIGASTNIMKRMFEKGITDQTKFLKQIEDIDKTIVRISKIITGLKNVSRDTSNEAFSNCSLKDILTDSLSICVEKFKSHGIKVDLDFNDPILDTQINCLRVQLSQVFFNLLSNSFDAIEQMPNPWVKIAAYKSNNFLIIRCEDSGLGIPKEIQSKIFQPFYTTKEVGKGTGLGLSLCNSIIQRHGGEFYIDSESQNTCFVVTLPISGDSNG